jgi:hypothetical protein
MAPPTSGTVALPSQPAPSGAITISWQAPLTNADGSTLTDLAGYQIHYGTGITAMDQVVRVPTPGLTNYVIDNLPAGTYYFSITSYTAAGAESAASAVISTTLG